MLSALRSLLDGYKSAGTAKKTSTSPNYETASGIDNESSPSLQATTKVQDIFKETIERNPYKFSFQNDLYKGITVKVTYENTETTLSQNQIIAVIPSYFGSKTRKSFEDSYMQEKDGLHSRRLQVLQTLENRKITVIQNPDTKVITQLVIGEEGSRTSGFW